MTATIHDFNSSTRKVSARPSDGRTTADVFWSVDGNAYVLVSSPNHGAFTYEGRRVALCSVDGAGDARRTVMHWTIEGALNTEAQGGALGPDASEQIAAARHFGLAPPLPAPRRRRAAR